MQEASKPQQRRHNLILAAAAAFACLSGLPSAEAAPEVRGTWSGLLEADDPPAQLTLLVLSDSTAELRVGAIGEIPLRAFRVTDGRVKFETRQPQLRFESKFTDDGELVCALQRADSSIPLTFIRGDFFTEPTLPQMPLNPLTVERLRALRIAARCPAMGVSCQRGEGSIQLLTEGQRSVRGELPVRHFDCWHLGSVTKSMTATLAARLVEQRRLDWSTTLHDILGSSIEMQAGYRELNLLHLLSHCGGLVRDVPQSVFMNLPASSQRAAYAKAAPQQSPIGTPGTSMVYSNADYVVAGLMLEHVGGAA